MAYYRRLKNGENRLIYTAKDNRIRKQRRFDGLKYDDYQYDRRYYDTAIKIKRETDFWVLTQSYKTRVEKIAAVKRVLAEYHDLVERTRRYIAFALRLKYGRATWADIGNYFERREQMAFFGTDVAFYRVRLDRYLAAIRLYDKVLARL